MESLPTVCVLMSTYNGEKYLREQLDSILSQEDVNVRLVVRDDGSTDNTLNILKGYEGVKLVQGENIGCGESFKYLLYLPEDADYYAFSDQDDVWHPRKLITAINNIKQYHVDLSVCNLMLADADMNLDKPLFSTKDIERIDYKFRNQVFGNLHGCVQVWTKELHKAIQSYKPDYIYSHDTWVNTIANMISSTYIDTQCYINYRLHGNNTAGYARGILERLKKGYKLYLRSNILSKYSLCNELLKGYGHMLNLDDKRFEYIKMMATYKDNLRIKVKLLFSDYINKTDFQHKVLFWTQILLNKY